MYTKIYKNAYRHTKLGKDCSHTFCYVRKHTYSTNIFVFISLVYKTLHSVERDFLQANPRFSTWQQPALLQS